jgi:hypothetical protein
LSLFEEAVGSTSCSILNNDNDLAIVSPDFCGDSCEDVKWFIPHILKVDSGIEIHTFRPEDFSTDNLFIAENAGAGIRIY